MTLTRPDRRVRNTRPSLQALEGRALLTATASHLAHVAKAMAPQVSTMPATGHVHTSATHSVTARAATPVVKIFKTVKSHGYKFVNFDGPDGGTKVGDGTLVRGISNQGVVVGWTLRTQGNGDIYAPRNFTASLGSTPTGQVLTQLPTDNAEARGINSAGVVAGTMAIAGVPDSTQAFLLDGNTVKSLAAPDWFRSSARGINDANVVVGHYQTPAGELGLVRLADGTILTIKAPALAGKDVSVVANGINNNGLIVGHYIVQGSGTQHAFTANLNSARNGVITLTPVRDPAIPAVPGKGKATLGGVELVGVNDRGIAVGSYGDMAGNNHGFLYNTVSRKYTFLDDPGAVPYKGQVFSEITGINNSNQIVGSYSDAKFIVHGFVATKL